jgi:hypothetical protein
VEALTGVPIPEKPKCCAGKVKACTVLRAIAVFALVIISSLFIAATSLLIAGGIVQSMSYVGPDGTAVNPSAPVAILVLILVTAIEMLLFVGILRGCRLMWYASPFPIVPTDDATSSSASAPPMIPHSTLSQPLMTSTSTGSQEEPPRYRSFFARVERSVRRLPALLGSSSMANFGYSHLPSSEADNASDYVEMSSYPASASTGTQASPPANMQYQYPVVHSVPLPVVHHQVYNPNGVTIVGNASIL